MKTSELIKLLQESIEKHGDCEVEMLNYYKMRPITGLNYHEYDDEEGSFAPNHANTITFTV